MSEVQTRPVRVMHLMDSSGHTSFGWDPNDDEWVLPMIRRKMAEGYTFWIVRRDPLREVRLERIEDVTDTRHVIIHHDAARRLFEEGRIGLLRGSTANEFDTEDETEASPVHQPRRARSAEEVVVADETVAHRPLRGG